MNESEIEDGLKKDINVLIEYYHSLCQNKLDEDIIMRLSIWIDDYIEKMKGNYPKREKKDISVYDEKLFEVLDTE